MKPIYAIVGSVLMFTACSQEEMPHGGGDGGSQVLFRTSLPTLTTRAQETTKDNLPGFYVTAFDLADADLVKEGVMQPLFGNQKISIVSGSDIQTSPSCCWPDPGKESHEVTFFGFHPEAAASQLVNASAAGTLDYKLKGFRVADDIGSQVDFITAYASGNMADNLFSGILLPFAHQLSRIEIKAYGAHKSCDIEIAGVRIGGTGVEGVFDFRPVDGGGQWEPDPTRGIVEYVYRANDKIFTCGKHNPVAKEAAVSIMGAKRDDGNDNCAMVIPGAYAEWDWAKDRRNGYNRMYISVLLRITDATPTAGVNPVETQRFPYRDLSQGPDSFDIPVVYLAVNKATGVVATRLYKKEGAYYQDEACTTPYTLPATEEVKEFGWAALPVKATWEPGNIYTYILDYTHGVGLHDPEVATTWPAAGDAVISDKVGITYTVKGWNDGGGDKFVVPGS